MLCELGKWLTRGSGSGRGRGRDERDGRDAAQQRVQLGAAGGVQEAARAHAAEHARDRRLHVVEDDRLPARLELFDQSLYALERDKHIMIWLHAAPSV